MKNMESTYYMPDSTGTNRMILSDAAGWSIRLSDADAEIMGTAWAPLPLTAAASTETVRAFVAERVTG